MSNQLLSRLRQRSDIKGPARAILMVLSDHADERGQCYLAHSSIARESGFSKTTVKNHLKLLQTAGEISWINRPSSFGDNDSNLYQIPMCGAGAGLGRAGAAPPTSEDDPRVGRELPEGGAGGGYKAPMKHPKEANHLSIVPTDELLLIEEEENSAKKSHVTDALWELFPKNARTRTSKRKVRKAWDKIPKDERVSIETAVDALKTWKRCQQWRKDGNQFVPGLHIWITDQQWVNLPELDEPAPSRYRSNPKPAPVSNEPAATAADVAELLQALKPRRMNS